MYSKKKLKKLQNTFKRDADFGTPNHKSNAAVLSVYRGNIPAKFVLKNDQNTK